MDNQIEHLYSKFLTCQGVSIDTRTIKEGELFFGINGENSNGAAYAIQALEKGAKYAIIDEPKFEGNSVVVVDDTLLALQALAIYHRKSLSVKVLAITGSNGKTTTKELIRNVLSQKYTVLATEGNYNNHLGVPLTILRITNSHEIAIIEMGASHIGEIADLCKIAQPHFGLITNIGQAHTEGFGGIEGVLRGKSELFDYLKKNQGVPFINLRDNYVANMTKRFDSWETFPSEDVMLIPHQEKLEFSINGERVESQLTGDYNFLNAAAATAVGRYFQVPDKEVREAIHSYSPENQRSQIIKKGTNTIIIDAYNANPDSMRLALKNLSRFKGKRVAILGDMNELSNSEEAHRQFGKEISRLNLEKVLLVGEKIRAATDFLPDCVHFTTTEKLKEDLSPNSFRDSVILLKASRTMKLEEVIEKL